MSESQRIRFFGPSSHWKGYQRANVHYLYFTKGYTAHEIAFLLALQYRKSSSVRRAAHQIRLASKSAPPPDRTPPVSAR